MQEISRRRRNNQVRPESAVGGEIGRFLSLSAPIIRAFSAQSVLDFNILIISVVNFVFINGFPPLMQEEIGANCQK